MSLGPWEIVLVVLVIIILFGGKKIPELARGLGKALKEFRKTTKDLKDEVNSAAEDVKSAVDETTE
jgi:sec-independent protein translocase protein TatA